MLQDNLTHIGVHNGASSRMAKDTTRAFLSDGQKAEKHRFLMDHPVPSISDRSTMNWIMISAASSLPKIPKARTFPMQP